MSMSSLKQPGSSLRSCQTSSSAKRRKKWQRSTPAQRRFEKIVEESPVFDPLYARYGDDLSRFSARKKKSSIGPRRCSSNISPRLLAGTPWLLVFSPGYGTGKAIDLRTIDRHPLASVGTLVLGLRCS